MENKNYIFKDQNLFKYEENIYKGNLNKDVASDVAAFYKTAPFPNYGETESIDELEAKVLKNDVVKSLKKYIGTNKKIIEVGSGTCQLSIALAYGTNNRCVAFDATVESLLLGVAFAKKNNIENIDFVLGDIFDDPFKNNYFDLVWSSGVLHHTENAFKGFKIIRNWVKKDGLIIVGLYNRYGRLWTILRQFLYKLTNQSPLSRCLVNLLDPHLRKKNLLSDQRIAWIRDQYEHPVETLHTLDEVLKWFDELNVDFIGSIPDATAEKEFLGFSQFDGNRGSLLSRLATQIDMLFSPLGQEGGLFLVIGRAR